MTAQAAQESINIEPGEICLAERDAPRHRLRPGFASMVVECIESGLGAPVHLIERINGAQTVTGSGIERVRLVPHHPMLGPTP